MTEEVAESELNTIFDPTTCVKKGLCPVTKIRGQDQDPLESHSLYYELHGTGPEKLLLIYGMNASSFNWEHQVEHFGRSDKFSVLVFDNRGVGNSGTPMGPYRTSDMAEDTITLLNYVGWTAKRDIHIVGGSLGGMIAMEIATRIPERIVSLFLGVTTAGGRPWSNLPPWKGFTGLMRTFTIREPEKRIPHALDTLFPQEWLNARADGDKDGRTNREVQQENYTKRVAITRTQQQMGAMSQMYAGLTHNVSPERLHQISSAIPKVLILTGDDDNLVRPECSKYLKENMPEAEYVVWEGTGHAIQLQHPDRFSRIIERVIEEGRQKVATS